MIHFSADRKQDIELYCIKCDTISRPTAMLNRQTCALCNASVICQCKICKKRYTNINSIYNHLNYECSNVEPQYKCSQCEYKAKRKSILRRHGKLKHRIRKCDFCSYKSRSIWKLNEHIYVEHNSRYTCPRCGKNYLNLQSFNNHKKLCGFELHFECNHCSYSTNLKSNLKVHIKSQHS